VDGDHHAGKADRLGKLPQRKGKGIGIMSTHLDFVDASRLCRRISTCDFFDLFVFSASTSRISSPQTKPSSWAVRLTDSSPDTALNGAQSKDLGGAYLTHAARSFSPTEARTGRTRHGTDLGIEDDSSA
jgi:hypothetical protein